MTLEWHSAKQEHRSHISTFSCTLPDHGSWDEDEGFVCHDYPWELEVQDFIRSLRPPVSTPQFLLVGYDDVGLAAVLVMRVTHLDRWARIQAVGVAQRVSGNGLAGEAIGLAPRVMAKYAITRDFTVEALVDPDNIAAQSAFSKAGYVHDGYIGGFQGWYRRF